MRELKLMTVLALAVLALVAVTGCNKPSDGQVAKAASTPPNGTPANPDGVAAAVWLADPVAAEVTAKEQGRPLLLYFWAEWSKACKALDSDTFPDPTVAARLSKWVTARVDLTSERPDLRPLQAKYRVQGLPTVVLVSSTGNWLEPLTLSDFERPSDFIHRLERAEAKHEASSSADDAAVDSATELDPERATALLAVTGSDGLGKLFPEYDAAVRAALDEFGRHDIETKLKPQFTERFEAEKRDLLGKVYFVRVRASLGDYDFEKAAWPLTLGGEEENLKGDGTRWVQVSPQNYDNGLREAGELRIPDGDWLRFMPMPPDEARTLKDSLRATGTSMGLQIVGHVRQPLDSVAYKLRSDGSVYDVDAGNGRHYIMSRPPFPHRLPFEPCAYRVCRAGKDQAKAKAPQHVPECKAWVRVQSCAEP